MQPNNATINNSIEISKHGTNLAAPVGKTKNHPAINSEYISFKYCRFAQQAQFNLIQVFRIVRNHLFGEKNKILYG